MSEATMIPDINQLKEALEYWKQHWLAPMPVTELSHRDEPEKLIYDAARLFASLTSEETIERLRAAVFEAEYDTLTWEQAKAAYTDEGGFDEVMFRGDHRYYYNAADAVLRAVEK